MNEKKIGVIHMKIIGCFEFVCLFVCFFIFYFFLFLFFYE